MNKYNYSISVGSGFPRMLQYLAAAVAYRSLKSVIYFDASVDTKLSICKRHEIVILLGESMDGISH